MAQLFDVAHMVVIEAEQVAMANEICCLALSKDARKGYEIELCAFDFMSLIWQK